LEDEEDDDDDGNMLEKIMLESFLVFFSSETESLSPEQSVLHIGLLGRREAKWEE